MIVNLEKLYMMSFSEINNYTYPVSDTRELLILSVDHNNDLKPELVTELVHVNEPH